MSAEPAKQLLRRTLAGLAQSAICLSCAAADFDSVTAGQIVEDNTVAIGPIRRFQLPEGTWTVIAKEIRPELPFHFYRSWKLDHHMLMLARIESSKIVAVLLFSAPFGDTSIPHYMVFEEPCKNWTNPYVTLDFGNLRLPECLVVTTEVGTTAFDTSRLRYDTEIGRSAYDTALPSAVFKLAAQWMQENGVATPDMMYRVYIGKFVQGKYLELNAYLPVNSADGSRPASAPPELLKWARDVDVVVRDIVSGSKGTPVLPALPSVASP